MFLNVLYGLLLSVVAFVQVFSATRYSTSNNGNWSSTATWSETYGNTVGGASIPTTDDVVVIAVPDVSQGIWNDRLSGFVIRILKLDKLQQSLPSSIEITATTVQIFLLLFYYSSPHRPRLSAAVPRAVEKAVCDSCNTLFTACVGVLYQQS